MSRSGAVTRVRIRRSDGPDRRNAPARPPLSGSAARPAGRRHRAWQDTSCVAIPVALAAAAILYFVRPGPTAGGTGASARQQRRLRRRLARPARNQIPRRRAPTTSAPNTAPTAGTPAPAASAPAPSAPAAASTGGRFEIVVASFRTDARAASVAAEVAALGLPMRRRVVGRLAAGGLRPVRVPRRRRGSAAAPAAAPASPARRLC